MSKTLGPRNTSDAKDRLVAFDANVWIFVMGYCNASAEKSAAYSQIYKELINFGCNIIVTEHIISEVFNRCLKYEFDLLCQDKPELSGKFKSFRSSKDFKDTIEGVRDTCLNIIEDNNFVSIDLQKNDMMDVITESGAGWMDAPDVILSNHCKKSGIIIVTDDRDFMHCETDIITANKYILSNRT